MRSRFLKLSTAILLSLSIAACGTILHPERKGQVSGQIDPAIAVLNGIGLLFYFIPGVIAFAVDFSNGTIYLPGGFSSQLSDEELDQLRNGEITRSELAARVTGVQVESADVQARLISDPEQVTL